MQIFEQYGSRQSRWRWEGVSTGGPGSTRLPCASKRDRIRPVGLAAILWEPWRARPRIAPPIGPRTRPGSSDSPRARDSAVAASGRCRRSRPSRHRRGRVGGGVGVHGQRIGQAALGQHQTEGGRVAVARVRDDRSGRQAQPVISSSMSSTSRHFPRCRTASGIAHRSDGELQVLETWSRRRTTEQGLEHALR